GTRLAGVEAAIWAETIESVDDLAFLLLPRLALVAEACWNCDPYSKRDAGSESARQLVEAASAHWGALGCGAFFRSSSIHQHRASNSPQQQQQPQHQHPNESASR